MFPSKKQYANYGGLLGGLKNGNALFTGVSRVLKLFEFCYLEVI